MKTRPRPIHRRFYGWYILVGSSIILFLSTGIGLYSLPIFILPIEDYFAATRTELSIFGGGLFLISGISGLFVGHLIHRVGPRKVMIWGAAVTSVGYMGLSQAEALWQLFLLGLPVALGIVGISVLPVQTLVAQWFEKTRGRAIGISLSSMTVGGMVMAPLAHELIAFLTWQGTYMFFGLLLLAIIWPLCFLVIRDTPQVMGLQPYGSDTASSEGDQTGTSSAQQGSSVQNNAILWRWTLVMFCVSIGIAMVNTHVVAMVVSSPLGVAQGAELAQQFAARLISLYLAFSIMGSLFAGWLADLYSHRRLLQLTYLMLAVSPVCLAWLESAVMAYVFAMTFGFGMGASMALSTVFVVGVFGLLRLSRILGLVGIALTLAMGIGPITAGLLFDIFGSYDWTYGAMVICFSAGIVIMQSIRPH